MKISLITATYNSAATLRETIKSVLNQTYEDIEYILVDGASSDNTIDIAHSYSPLFKGKMIIISEHDRGIYDALNKGISMSTGDIIGFIHADDTLADNNVLEHINNTFQHSQCDILYGDLSIISRQTKQIVRHWKSCSFSPQLLRRGWMPPHPTLYATKQTYEKSGSFNIEFKISADYDFIIRSFKATDHKMIKYTPYTIVKMNIGGTSTKITNLGRVLYEDWIIIRKNKIGGIGTLIMKKVSKLTQFKNNRTYLEL